MWGRLAVARFFCQLAYLMPGLWLAAVPDLAGSMLQSDDYKCKFTKKSRSQRDRTVHVSAHSDSQKHSEPLQRSHVSFPSCMKATQATSRWSSSRLKVHVCCLAAPLPPGSRYSLLSVSWLYQGSCRWLMMWAFWKPLPIHLKSCKLALLWILFLAGKSIIWTNVQGSRYPRMLSARLPGVLRCTHTRTRPLGEFCKDGLWSNIFSYYSNAVNLSAA